MMRRVGKALVVLMSTWILVGCASNPEHSLKRSYGEIELCEPMDNCAQEPTRMMQRAIDEIVVANFPERAGVYKAVMWKDGGQTFAVTGAEPEIHLSTSMYVLLTWNELVAVMAHELAHQEENHPRISAGVNSAIWVADKASWFITPWLILSPVDELVKAKFSRHMEMEADVLAIQYLENAGYSKADYLGLLERVAEMENGTGCRVWCTHPHVEDRIRAVKEGRNILYVDIDKKDETSDH